MKRRTFITLFGGADAAPLFGPRAAHAQPAGMPVIGYLGPPQPGAERVAAFRKGLGALGYVEGQNFLMEYRGTEHYDQLPALAAEFVRRRVSVIVATGNILAARAAKAATSTIPIVFANGGDPIRYGLVTSLNRPGGNVTGVSYLTGVINPKRLELIRELVPSAAVIGFLTNPAGAISEGDVANMQAAARSVGQELQVLEARTADDIDVAFETMQQKRIGALIVSGDSLMFNRRSQIVILAARHRMPASYSARDYPLVGGLMSYGDDRLESQRLAGVYAGRILKGEKPGDLPVLQPTKFELVVNLKSAKAIGLVIPESFLVRADEVIE